MLPLLVRTLISVTTTLVRSLQFIYGNTLIVNAIVNKTRLNAIHKRAAQFSGGHYNAAMGYADRTAAYEESKAFNREHLISRQLMLTNVTPSRIFCDYCVLACLSCNPILLVPRSLGRLSLVSQENLV